MNTNELLHVIQILKETGYSHIDLTHEGSHILLSNTGATTNIGATTNTAVTTNTGMLTNAVATFPVETVNNSTKENNVSHEINQNSPTKELAGHVVESPIVGTFYSSSNPDVEPFVSVGSIVKKGQVMCIIEAMKLMNEIESDKDGTVIEILVKNEQGVEYGQPLFKIV